MGLRGARSGAKAKRSRDTAASRPPWKAPRLSRSESMIRFLESLPVTKSMLAGKKMRLLPGQKIFVRTIYAKRPRSVRLAVKSEPRGNGKTGLTAGLALAHLLGPEAERRGEVYACAADKKQSSLIFAEAVAIIEATPQFADRVNIQRFHKIIEVMSGDGAGSIFEALSADVRRPHGLSPTLWIFDELGQARGSELLDGLITAQGKRKESLGIVISTQAPSDQHPLSQLIDDGLRGLDPSVYVQLTAAPVDADPFAEETWRACNEAWGVFLNADEFRDQARRAERLPSFRAAFLNLRLNQRIDATTKFISDPDWMLCATPVDRQALRGKPCIGGLDLSATTDMTSLQLFFPHDGSVLSWFWLPHEGLMDRDRHEGVPYRLWRDSGLLETTPGRAIDYRAIVLRLAEIVTEFDVQSIAYDRAFIKQLQRLLDEEAVVVPLVEFGQGFVSMAPAVQALEAAVLDRRIKHGGHPILRWNASNAAIDVDPAGNRKVSKKRSLAHVDGLVALLMAIGQHNRQPAPAEPKYQMLFI
ncbi:MAG: terminase large subunit [Rhizobiales bacterium]|nr:terminase large subunit [Hyphomicrobiales bacterium]